ncbi:SDR family oxidoreductase [Parvibaculum sp.]|uniref:SDR family oxidoreductase n=1 Tax=Parvibaculum sp. TaxID=2024848 RepID=UPI002C2DD101|nr:SDR family oxidoreductase [Parvibaculum sp.]HUD50712.1 SDR family oxidoreductase [Parvibaculum sp.]
MSIDLDLEGKSVLVTGGTKGVGRGIAERFLEAGADVAICGRNAPETLPRGGGREAVFFASDVRDVEQAKALIDAVVARFGKLDVLVNNAGGSPPADAATASPRFSEAIIRLNLIAPLNLAQLANAAMQKQDRGGVVINIASVSGVRPSPGTAAYGAAKAGLLNLTTSLAQEWAPKVRVNAITAGMIRTEQADLFYGGEAGLAVIDAAQPMKRIAVPADIGNACLYLASALAGYVTGARLDVHGGGERPPFLEQAESAKG